MTLTAFVLILASLLLHSLWHFLCKSSGRSSMSFFAIFSTSLLLTVFPLGCCSGKICSQETPSNSQKQERSYVCIALLPLTICARRFDILLMVSLVGSSSLACMYARQKALRDSYFWPIRSSRYFPIFELFFSTLNIFLPPFSYWEYYKTCKRKMIYQFCIYKKHTIQFGRNYICFQHIL